MLTSSAKMRKGKSAPMVATQTPVRMVDFHGVLRGIARVLRDPDVEGSSDVDLLEVREEVRQPLLVVEGVHGRQLGLQGLYAETFYPGLVHEAGVEIADLLSLRSRWDG